MFDLNSNFPLSAGMFCVFFPPYMRKFVSKKDSVCVSKCVCLMKTILIANHSTVSTII